jgi:hypothetical protein
MESEGPYTIDEENGQCCVVGPGYQKPGARIIQNGDYWPTRMLQLDMNLAHAEGRKSMEKEFKELLDIANSMEFLAGCRSSARAKFGAWKKARGIE